MKKNAQLYISTDWENYAESILSSINENNLFIKLDDKYTSEVTQSKFERRGQKEGRKIFKFKIHKIKVGGKNFCISIVTNKYSKT